MFNFDLFKYVATDPSTIGLAGATTVLDYYGQKASYDKQVDYLNYQDRVLEESKVAKENGVMYNTYLSTLVSKQQAEANKARQREVSAQSIAHGAEIGQKGSAAALVARDAQFQLAKISGQASLAKDQITNKGQAQIDNITLQYKQSQLDLDYKEHNLSSPSIFSAVVDTTETIYSDFSKFKRARAIEEKLIDATSDRLGTGIK